MSDTPTKLQCWHCDLGTGLANFARPVCPKCAGTGMIYWVAGRLFPATKKGLTEAKLALAEFTKKELRGYQFEMPEKKSVPSVRRSLCDIRPSQYWIKKRGKRK